MATLIKVKSESELHIGAAPSTTSLISQSLASRADKDAQRREFYAQRLEQMLNGMQAAAKVHSKVDAVSAFSPTSKPRRNKKKQKKKKQKSSSSSSSPSDDDGEKLFHSGHHDQQPRPCRKSLAKMGVSAEDLDIVDRESMVEGDEPVMRRRILVDTATPSIPTDEPRSNESTQDRSKLKIDPTGSATSGVISGQSDFTNSPSIRSPLNGPLPGEMRPQFPNPDGADPPLVKPKVGPPAPASSPGPSKSVRLASLLKKSVAKEREQKEEQEVVKAAANMGVDLDGPEHAKEGAKCGHRAQFMLGMHIGRRLLDTYDNVAGRGMAPQGVMRWRRGTLLGQGAFGKVYLALNFDNGKLMAAKELQFSNDDEETVADLTREVNLIANLDHPNIVRYFGTSVTHDADPTGLSYCYIFLEYVPGGTLLELLSKFGRFNEPLIRMYTLQLLRGLEYLHEHDIVHRDIKPANALMDERGGVKLADFGASIVASKWDTCEEKHAIKGTPFYMAPDAIQSGRATKEADVWSVGCTIVQMLTAKYPWDEKKWVNAHVAMYYIATHQELPYYPKKGVSPPLRALIEMMLNRNPDERPCATDLLAKSSFLNTHPKSEAALEPQGGEGSGSEEEIETSEVVRNISLTIGGKSEGSSTTKIERSASADAACLNDLAEAAGDVAVESKTIAVVNSADTTAIEPPTEAQKRKINRWFRAQLNANVLAAWCQKRAADEVKSVLTEDMEEDMSEADREQTEALRKAVDAWQNVEEGLKDGLRKFHNRWQKAMFLMKDGTAAPTLASRLKAAGALSKNRNLGSSLG